MSGDVTFFVSATWRAAKGEGEVSLLFERETHTRESGDAPWQNFAPGLATTVLQTWHFATAPPLPPARSTSPAPAAAPAFAARFRSP